MNLLSKNCRLRPALAWLIGLAAAPFCASGAAAQTQAELEKLFTGSTITIIGSNAGSGADIMIRASAEILGDFLPASRRASSFRTFRVAAAFRKCDASCRPSRMG